MPGIGFVFDPFCCPPQDSIKRTDFFALPWVGSQYLDFQFIFFVPHKLATWTCVLSITFTFSSEFMNKWKHKKSKKSKRPTEYIGSLEWNIALGHQKNCICFWLQFFWVIRHYLQEAVFRMFCIKKKLPSFLWSSKTKKRKNVFKRWKKTMIDKIKNSFSRIRMLKN